MLLRRLRRHVARAWRLPAATPPPARRAASTLAPPPPVDARRQGGADLRQPHTWYPLARSIKRRVIFHAGPTNSGKTHNALAALRAAYTGAYAGPLRLLALEVYEALNLDGVPCSLLTGQERRATPFAGHAASTVEMLDTGRRVDVAVIDEIQMIGDEQRGASWTRALLGAPAAEVHVCGDPAAEPVVRALAAVAGDELEVRRYERLTAITPLPAALEGDYGRVQAGDAVVAFSRKDIYDIRRAIERRTPLKCCVVYGSLPSATRSAQARLFNDPASGYRVLVASDAIGMGLNLNIRRVVFHTMEKFNGVSVGPVPPAQVKQIAGRAGRRSSIYPEGFATTLHATDNGYLHACMAAPTPPITAAGLQPDAEQLAAFAAGLPPDTPLSAVMRLFASASLVEGPYFVCRFEDAGAMADILEPYRAVLPVEARAALALMPANLRNRRVRAHAEHFLDQYAAGAPVALDVQLPLNDPAYLARDLEGLETKATILETYLWLAERLGGARGGSFPAVAEAVAKRAAVGEMLEAALWQLTEDTKAPRGGRADARARGASHARIDADLAAARPAWTAADE